MTATSGVFSFRRQSLAINCKLRNCSWVEAMAPRHTREEKMTATPKPTPSFTRIAEQLAGPKVAPVAVAYPPASITSFGRDAILPINTVAQHGVARSTLADVVAQWRATIAAERLVDAEVVHWRSPSNWSAGGLTLRTTDGALLMRAGAERAFTPRGWASLVSLLAAENSDRPSGLSNVLAWLSPEVRSLAFEDLKARSKRREDDKHPLLVRLYSPAEFPHLRAVRAVLSGRHSGTHFDDAVLADVFLNRWAPSVPAFVSRAVDSTHGHVVFGETLEGLTTTLAFQNSETGASSLSFSGAARIAAIGSLVTVPGNRVEALIATAFGRTRRAHTLPRVHVTDDERAGIAWSRLNGDIDRAVEAAEALRGAWTLALQSFPVNASLANLPADAAPILVDAILERTGAGIEGTEEFRQRLATVIADNQALAESKLPKLSAAWVAAVYALLAHEEPTAEGARKLSNEAGRWVIDRW